ncbi:hypothetical protein [Paracidovorax anthurii]|uniref:hypothetical protein n=1 Tax=Paracidovorax anthurii TaxID=78229 RepID=UPI0011BE149D|nr:hypothetical protein [Paracidovorax anthurii]
MLSSVTSSFPDTYSAQFFGAAAANDGSTPPAESLPDPSVDAGLVAQSSVGGGECPSEDRVLALDECRELDRLSWATRDGHDGCFSAGGFVLIALQQAADMCGYLSNSERVAAYDRLCRHAEYAIGAGC